MTVCRGAAAAAAAVAVVDDATAFLNGLLDVHSEHKETGVAQRATELALC
jgi:hypothetical protein